MRRDCTRSKTMHTALFRAIFAASIATACVVTAGCRVDELNLNADDARVNGDVDPNVDLSSVQQGEWIPIHIHVENVYLVDPGETPPAAHKNDAGHIQVYLDDFDSEPLLVTAS